MNTDSKDEDKNIKIESKSNSIVVLKGQNQIICLLNNSKKVKWSSSNKNIKIVRKNKAYVVIKGNTKGTSTLIATIGKKKYKCKVKVLLYKMTKNEQDALKTAQSILSRGYGCCKKGLKDELLEYTMKAMLLTGLSLSKTVCASASDAKKVFKICSNIDE